MKFQTLAWIVTAAVSCSVYAATPSPSASPWPVDSALEGPTSRYTPWVIREIKSWPSKLPDYSDPSPAPVKLACYATPDHSFYIGVVQWMVVHAPLARVQAVLDDFGHYRDLFPGFEDVHVISRDSNRVVTSWEQHIPIPFVPNVKYQLTYLLDRSHPDRRIYRYQLKTSNALTADDGFIVIEKDPANADQTRYSEFDFYDADWGIAKTLAPGKIWKDSVEGLFLSDAAIKLKAEQPELSYEKIAERSAQQLDKFPVDACVDHKRALPKQTP